MFFKHSLLVTAMQNFLNFCDLRFKEVLKEGVRRNLFQLRVPYILGKSFKNYLKDDFQDFIVK